MASNRTFKEPGPRKLLEVRFVGKDKRTWIIGPLAWECTPCIQVLLLLTGSRVAIARSTHRLGPRQKALAALPA